MHVKTVATLLAFIWATGVQYIQQAATIFEQEERTLTEMYPLLSKKFEELGIRFPEVVAAQAFHETGCLTSRIYLTCHNLFGMKYNRRGYAKGECYGHAFYNDATESILDYKEYQDKYLTMYENTNGKIKDNEQYITFLRWAHYAEDPSYGKKLNIWLERINNGRRQWIY